ncbi:hypothetical protein [Anaerococcus sp.]|uniref:hypothetical protein n=1 Tax=Anaerococcus sp. TaxID=1872515 RepID=UPI002A90E98E|nr:hypothetical protein [Anaerococcus sp.]MDY6127006.1 hypothetical protein [Anaerococcus sp.]
MRIRKNIYTKKDVDIIRKTEFEEGKNKGIDIALQKLIVIPMLFLRDKEGYGGGRLENFIDYFKMTMDCLDDESVSLKDMANTLEKETKISFKGILNERD